MGIRRPLIAAAVAAIIVFISTYYAENKDISIAGLIAAMPIAIPVTLILNEKGAFQDWTFSFLTGMVIYAISALSLHILYRNGMTKKSAVMTALLIWLSLIGLSYCCIVGMKRDDWKM